jgi:DNA recombination protein RmuC
MNALDLLMLVGALVLGGLVGALLGGLSVSSRAATERAALSAALDGADARRADAQRAYEQLVDQVNRGHERDTAVATLVAPLRDTLGKVEQQLRDAEQERAAAHAALGQQVEAVRRSSDELRREAATLSTALRAPQVRGRWGEQQLERLVEAAGMVEHCDFVTQASSTTEAGTMRPDLVVRLAGGKQVVVDAKVPFVGYLEALGARDEATQAARLAAHARHLRTHVGQLAAKAYWERFTPSPEFVVMFVPSDGFLAVALEHDPALLEHGFEQNVIIATPSTLVALLRTIAYGWRQEAVAENARAVLDLGRELHSRLATMGNHLSQLGRELGSAVGAFNKTIGSLETRVLVTARRFADLRVTDGSLDPPPGVVDLPRPLAAPELLGPDTVVELRPPRAANA